jgi:hypothetical protein
MKKWFALPIAIMIANAAVAQTDPWTNLRVLEGKWEGPTTGKPGKGVTSREYRFELDGHFLSERNKVVYEAETPGAKPKVHEDLSFLSYDTRLKKIVWWQFHSEGFVHEYTLDSASADGKSLDFFTVRMNNIPPGFRAKESYRILSAGEVDSTFWLAEPGKDFEVYTQTRLKRVK